MKASLIFGLIVQVALSLIQKTFVDSVNWIVHNSDIKNKQIYHYLLLKKRLKFYRLLTSFEVNFEICLNKFRKLLKQRIYLYIS